MEKNNYLKQIRRVSSVIGLSVVLAACGGDDKAPPAPQAPQAVVQPAQSKDITIETKLPGRTAASVISQVRPQVGGIILSYNFNEGTHVEAGQQLYQIDPSVYEANLRQAVASLEKAKANRYAAKLRAERYNALSQSKAVSQQDIADANAALMQAEADILAAEAQITNAEINLQYTKVLAPISGQIGRSNFTQGALVTPGQQTELALINTLNPMNVNITYSSAEYATMRQNILNGTYTPTQVENLETGELEDGHIVKIYLEDGTLYDKTGTIQFSDLTVDPTTGSVFMQAQVENDGSLFAGMFVNTEVQQGIQNDAVLISQKAIIQAQGGKSFVIVVDDKNVATIRPVTMSRSYGGDWVISSGLKAGENVVVEGIQTIQAAINQSPNKQVTVQIVPASSTQGYAKAVPASSSTKDSKDKKDDKDSKDKKDVKDSKSQDSKDDKSTKDKNDDSSKQDEASTADTTSTSSSDTSDSTK